MPAPLTVPVSEKPICVTGGTGFIAAHIIKQLLEKGYKVRATVRNASDTEKMAVLTQLPRAEGNLELVDADLNVSTSFDKAVDGCEYVLHVASPYHINVKDPRKDLVDPAVNGTISVLKSCQKSGSVKKVILTSSVAAITDEPESSRIYTEKDWNEKSSLSRNPYYYSKKLAEEAAWKFMKNVPESRKTLELVVINPFFVMGPSLSTAINESNKIIIDMCHGAYPAVMDLTWGVVDVRDVATAHVLAMENPKATGRYLCANQLVSMREVVRILRKECGNRYKLPSSKLKLTGTIGNTVVKLGSWLQPRFVGTYLRTNVGRACRFDNSKIKEKLGLSFLPVEQTILDTLHNLQNWNHLVSSPVTEEDSVDSEETAEAVPMSPSTDVVEVSSSDSPIEIVSGAKSSPAPAEITSTV